MFPHIKKDNNVNWLDRRLLAICAREPLNINRKWFFILKINFKHFVSHKLHIDVVLSALIKAIKKSVLLTKHTLRFVGNMIWLQCNI